MKQYRFRRGLRFLAFALVAIGLAGLVVMWLWNALLPDILGVRTVSFWQALGLLLLSRILFGGFGPRGYGPPGYGRRGNNRRSEWQNRGRFRARWKQKMQERWQQLTPEQREQMKAQWRNRCGNWGPRNADVSDRQPPADSAANDHPDTSIPVS